MSNILIIKALLRLFDYASIRRFNLIDKHITFDDEIGKKAISINNQLKSSKGLDIFDKKMKLEELTRYESLLGFAMSNYVNKKIVLRKINDEIKMLKNAKNIDPNKLSNFNVQFSKSLEDTIISKVSSTDSKSLLQTILKTDFLYLLPNIKLRENYFSQSTITLNDTKLYLISVLSHESMKKEDLLITSTFVLNRSEYSQFDGNPIQLFLKGLDKFGIDMNINDSLSRYYYWIEVPLNTNIESFEFLNLQNIKKNEPFSLSMLIKRTSKSIEMQNVYATRTNLILKEFNGIQDN